MGIFSSRKLGKAFKENIYFIWLAGNQKPDFRTINAFRGEELKETYFELMKRRSVAFIQSGTLIFMTFAANSRALYVGFSAMSSLFALSRCDSENIRT